MSLKQIQFQVNRRQIDLEDDPESPRLQHGSCSSHQELSIAASLTLFRSVSKEQFTSEDSDLIRYNPDRSNVFLQLSYTKFLNTINFFC
jgi:hypothetical protein